MCTLPTSLVTSTQSPSANPSFGGGFGIHPQARFVGILVQQLVVLRAKLGVLRHLAGQQVELIFAGHGRLFPGRPGRETGIGQRFGIDFDLAGGRVEGDFSIRFLWLAFRHSLWL